MEGNKYAKDDSKLRVLLHGQRAFLAEEETTPAIVNIFALSITFNCVTLGTLRTLATHVAFHQVKLKVVCPINPSENLSLTNNSQTKTQLLLNMLQKLKPLF